MRRVPNHTALREWLKEHEISQMKASRVVGVDGRTFRRYTAPPDQPGHSNLPWSAWMLLRMYAGEVTAEEFRQEVDGVRVNVYRQWAGTKDPHSLYGGVWEDTGEGGGALRVWKRIER